MPRDDQPLEITPGLLLQAYSSGVFPMADTAEETIHWIDPLMRGVLPLDALHVSRSLRKTILRGGYIVTLDTAFEEVMRACADRDETWISEDLIAAYTGLHHQGFAHSVELRDLDGTLMGGLYGVSMGGAFFGESMFSRRPSTSRIALVWLVARLRAGGFTLLDTQFTTEHLESMGAVEIPRAQYHARLAQALRRKAHWSALPALASASDVLQLTTQTS